MKIDKELSNKDPRLVGIFCLMAAERLAGIYEAFANEFSISNSDFKKGLDEGVASVLGSKSVNIETLIQSIAACTPDSEDYSDVLADQAQCAAICLMYSLEYTKEYNPVMIGYVLQKIEESIDILDCEGVLARELEWQFKLLNMLESEAELNQNVINRLSVLNLKYAIPKV